LLLVEIRSTVVQENLSDEALKGPTLEAIIQATNNIPIRNIPKVIPPLTECITDVNISITRELIILRKMYLGPFNIYQIHSHHFIFIIVYRSKVRFVRS
jgi:hypothetical protein